MDEHDVLKVANTLPLAQIVVVHMGTMKSLAFIS